MVIDKNTKITLGLVITLIGCVASFLYAMNNLSSKEYVDARLKDVKEHFDKENAEREKNLDYVRNRVDQIYEYLIEFRRRNK